jgi:hypothetical protein
MISKKQREQIRLKFGGLCAYSGTPLEDDWQIDHVDPIIRYSNSFNTNRHTIENMVPCQKIINHYKGYLSLEEFRTWYLGGLHNRIGKPKNPRTEKSKRKKEYLNKVASYFGITQDKPFKGVFYFEMIPLKPKRDER